MIYFYPVANFESLEQALQRSGNDRLYQRYLDNKQAIQATRKQIKYSKVLPTTYMRKSRKELESELAIRSKVMRGIAQSAGYGKYAPVAEPPTKPVTSVPRNASKRPTPAAVMPNVDISSPHLRADVPLNSPVYSKVDEVVESIPEVVKSSRLAPYAKTGAVGLGLGLAGYVGYNLYKNRNSNIANESPT